MNAMHQREGRLPQQSPVVTMHHDDCFAVIINVVMLLQLLQTTDGSLIIIGQQFAGVFGIEGERTKRLVSIAIVPLLLIFASLRSEL